jgi:hypothetical protein
LPPLYIDRIAYVINVGLFQVDNYDVSKVEELWETQVGLEDPDA